MPQRTSPFHSAAPSGIPGSSRPGARERGRMRRRLREQRRMREALLLDLGALVFELQRHGRREPELLQAKAAELSAVDNEVRALAAALDAGQDTLALVATGVAGSCGKCGSLLSTDARYCQACGAPAMPSLASDRTRDREPALGPAAPSPLPGHESPQAPGLGAGTGDPVGASRTSPAPRSAPRPSRLASAGARLERMRELVRRRNP